MRLAFPPTQIILRGVLPAMLAFLLACPAGTSAQTTAAAPSDQDHIVSSQALQQQVQDVSTIRQNHIDNVTNFLSTPAAEKAMRDAHVDAAQVRTAIPTLSDKELADISARATNARQEFAAGHIGPSLLTIIIIAIVVIIVVSIVH
jgi:hypothetical protein